MHIGYSPHFHLQSRALDLAGVAVRKCLPVKESMGCNRILLGVGQTVDERTTIILEPMFDATMRNCERVSVFN